MKTKNAFFRIQSEIEKIHNDKERRELFRPWIFYGPQLVQLFFRFRVSSPLVSSVLYLDAK